MTGGKWSNGRTVRRVALGSGPWSACGDCVVEAYHAGQFKALPFGSFRCDDGERRCYGHADIYLGEGAREAKEANV